MVNSLPSSEIRVLIAIATLLELGEAATAEKISRATDMNIRYVRNLLKKLEIKGLLKSYTPSGFGFMAKPSSGKIWILREDLHGILNKHPEIVEWTSNIPEEDLRAKNKEELLKKIKNIKNTKLGEEIKRKIEAE
jgi:DNA-binding transcriptional ArsR family regulator